MNDSPDPRPDPPTEETSAPDSAEPAFNAPPASLILLLLLGAAYLTQAWVLTPADVVSGALSSRALAEGRWWTLVSYIFLHAGLAHFLMNAGAALAFGPAVARHFGPGPRSGGVFFLYFLTCGVIAGLAAVVMHLGDPSLVVGASGAISGLWGGAARLLGRWQGLWGPFEGPVRGQIAVVVVLNLGIAVLGLVGEAAGLALRIAWEAHIAGFIAGLLLIGPFVRLARPSYRAER